MDLIVVGNRKVAVRHGGYLVYQSDWDERVAEFIAASEGVFLTGAHWEIIHFMRAYYREYQHLPNNRQFTKAVEKTLGPDKGNSRYLYGLFPNGPLRLACKIGGLPRPPSCII
ncbi:TusE/DsrC/DsvC family sulfur relay protein [Methylogaea oryzae]|uniref:Sulfurtransferase n=1 Tax=Methylogaea oryzae TaxID=1295382 RepID=A0A8D4VNT3_9GAMM|nr:TusE/DsrC/DsvC family sulfur relay protein [Methylogaea oryzae]BBL70472.1 sulfurtransferase [Methylogaea oryzae]